MINRFKGVGKLGMTLAHVSAITTMLSGCTAPTMKEQISEWGLDDIVNVQVGNGSGDVGGVVSKELLLAYTFTNGGSSVNDTVSNFTQQQEGFAQESLTNDSENLATIWTNKRYGEIKFVPGKYYKNSGRQCREFVAKWVLHHDFSTPMTENGKACQNQVTKKWEWS